MSARAMLAWRRARGFAVRWTLGVGALAIAALIPPFVAGDPRAPDAAALERLAADTLRSARSLRLAEAAVTSAESLLVSARGALARVVPIRAAPSTPVAPPPPDAVLAELTRRVDVARRLRTTEALLDVAAHPTVSRGPRMRALADSLRALDVERAADPTAPTVLARAPIVARIGNSIIAIGANRVRQLEQAAGATIASAPASPASALPASALPSSVPVATTVRDTTVFVASLAAARDTLARARRTHDSLTAALRSREGATTRPAPRSMVARLLPALAVLAVLLVGLALRLVTALRSEMHAPTLADAAEAERLTGLRTLTTVRDALLDGPARFKPSGVDPFRMLYLSLTATGTRARTAVVVGSDPEISAATGARLAIAAAADHRNTLIVDLDASHITLSRTFRERAEPGLSDVLARAFTWREVARPVGSSDGLPITLLPAGTEREAPERGVEFDALMAEFERFRGQFELTLAVTPLSEIDLATAMVAGSPILLTAVAGETSLDSLVAITSAQRAAGRKLAGLVIWDAPRPVLPTRAELVAQLSKRKGRTPGGSFEAVRRAIDPDNRGIRKP
jgi:hypothetical protein